MDDTINVKYHNYDLGVKGQGKIYLLLEIQPNFTIGDGSYFVQ